MNHAANLAHSYVRFVNVIAVIEGFRTQDLPELLSRCDRVSILLPSDSEGEDIGARDLIAMLSQKLGRERLSVYYSDNMGSSYNSGDRRLVV